jgi:hypothetical protein
MFDSESAVSFVIQQERRQVSGFLIVLEEEPYHGYLTSTQKSTVTCLHFSQQLQNFNPGGEFRCDCPAE